MPWGLWKGGQNHLAILMHIHIYGIELELIERTN